MNAPMVDFATTDCSKETAREKINYKEAKPLVVYTGKVGITIAEVGYILDAAAQLPQYRFMFTGGRQKSVDHFRKICDERKLKNVTFTGFLNDVYSVRYYQLAADVLVSYYNTKDHLVDFNYPQKIQEYLSTHNPVVTPDFAATREVINDQNAFLVEPDNPSALVEGIRIAVENKELAGKKAAAAFLTSRKNTFDYRINEFLDFFEKLVS
jgi:glycosyltransferase involved in cell wall biosynthesis